MTQRNREKVFLSASGLAVAAALIAGFAQMGSPSGQRTLEADRARIRDLRALASNIVSKRIAALTHRFPSSLAEARDGATYLRTTDPVTKAPYEYLRQSDEKFELCAVFESDSAQDQLDTPGPDPEARFWTHPRGRHCFSFEAGRVPPSYE